MNFLSSVPIGVLFLVPIMAFAIYGVFKYFFSRPSQDQEGVNRGGGDFRSEIHGQVSPAPRAASEGSEDTRLRSAPTLAGFVPQIEPLSVQAQPAPQPQPQAQNNPARNPPPIAPNLPAADAYGDPQHHQPALTPAPQHAEQQKHDAVHQEPILQPSPVMMAQMEYLSRVYGYNSVAGLFYPALRYHQLPSPEIPLALSYHDGLPQPAPTTTQRMTSVGGHTGQERQTDTSTPKTSASQPSDELSTMTAKRIIQQMA